MFNLFKKRTKAQSLDKKQFEQAIIENKSIIIMFGAGWCGACKMQKPIIHEMADHHKDSNTIIALVDTDQETELARSFEITALPTIIALRANKLVFKKAGLVTRRDLEKLFSDLEKTS